MVNGFELGKSLIEYPPTSPLSEEQTSRVFSAAAVTRDQESLNEGEAESSREPAPPLGMAQVREKELPRRQRLAEHRDSRRKKSGSV